MRFVKLINYKFINWQEVSHCGIEYDVEGVIAIRPYFYLKNGQKFDAFEFPNYFTLDESHHEYIFCEYCCFAYFEILLKNICLSFDEEDIYIFDIERCEKGLWNNFISWAKHYDTLVKKF